MLFKFQHLIYKQDLIKKVFAVLRPYFVTLDISAVNVIESHKPNDKWKEKRSQLMQL